MRKIIRTLINEGIKTEDIVAITKYLLEEYNINELNTETAVNCFKKRAENADDAWNNYVDARQAEIDGATESSDVRRELHKDARQQEIEALIAGHKVHKNKKLTKKWADKKGVDVKFTDKEEKVPELDSGSDMVVDGEKVTNRSENRKKLTPEQRAEIERLNKRSQRYTPTFNWEP